MSIRPRTTPSSEDLGSRSRMKDWRWVVRGARGVRGVRGVRMVRVLAVRAVLGVRDDESRISGWQR